MVAHDDKVASISQEAQTASIVWIHSMSPLNKWNLTANEIAQLLAITTETYQDLLYKANHKSNIFLSKETLERLSILLGIWRCLQFISPTDRIDLAYAGFNTSLKDELFSGKSIKQFLLAHNDLNSFYMVRRFLERTLI
jgi:hypothetical protein